MDKSTYKKKFDLEKHLSIRNILTSIGSEDKQLVEEKEEHRIASKGKKIPRKSKSYKIFLGHLHLTHVRKLGINCKSKIKIATTLRDRNQV